MDGRQFKVSKFQQFVVDRIKKARDNAGMTQEQVAQGGIDLRNFQKIEAGHTTPTLPLLYRFACIVGTTVSALVDAPSDLYLTEQQRLALLAGKQRRRRHRKKSA
jgi:transcriptional regulator with XRE-family HTH domain